MVGRKENFQKMESKGNQKTRQADKERLEEEDMPLNDSTCGHLQLNILQIL